MASRGRSGLQSSVLLFSTADDASTEVPISIVTDHAFGLRCVSFSADMRFLATLGDYKDGFLFLWSFNSRTGQLSLHSTNKCTANICDMAWCGSRSCLVTVGTRCIRVWGSKEVIKQQSPVRKPRYRPSDMQPSSPGPTPLTSRNVLLGSMVDCTFTCVVSVDDSHVVVGTETGHVCLVDVSQSVLELKVLKKLNLAVSSIAFLHMQRRLLIGTSRGVQYENLDVLCMKGTLSPQKLSQQKPPRLSIRRSLGLLHETEKSVIAIAAIADHTVTLDNNGSLQIQTNDPSGVEATSPIFFAAHKSVILGVQALPRSAGRGNFFTYSKNGEVRFWSDGNLLAQESLTPDPTESEDESCDNDLTQMRYASGFDSFIVADRLGVLKLIGSQEWEIKQTIRAHSAEITCVAVLDSGSLVATSSRDRTVQIFRIDANALMLLQTCDAHVASVNQVLFAQDGMKLLSCSADRSLVICERATREEGDLRVEAFLTTKVLSLKSSPLSMTMVSENILVVSTMDRCVTKVDVSSGTLLETVKTGDSETYDNVSLNSVLCAAGPGGLDSQKVLIGYCSTDKSIRIYSEKSASLLVRESGHTEGVSDIALLEKSAHGIPGCGPVFVSTGLDGTIMIWSVLKAAGLPQTPGVLHDNLAGLGFFGDVVEMAKPSPASLPPMRKVLSKIEIADLTRAAGQLSPSVPRALSPVRLKRKTSRLALLTSAEEVEETPKGEVEATPPKSAKSPNVASVNTQRSPSPPGQRKLRGQRSRPDLGTEVEPNSAKREGSLSPPPIPVPPVPKGRQQANNSRLRRAPSVPADLRSHAAHQNRRPSMGQASEFGSLAMATDQATRMLKIYRKKLINSKETVELNEIEYQVVGLLKTIRERKDRTLSANQREGEVGNRKEQAKAATEGDLDELAVLLEASNISESRTAAVEGVGLGFPST